jgi:hypothetical protein
MEQLAREVHILMVVNLIVACGFGFIVFCWFCELANKWMGVGRDPGSVRREQRIAAKEQAFNDAVAAAVADQLQQLQAGAAPAGGTSP